MINESKFESFFKAIEQVKQAYPKDSFNIFYALHKAHDEVNLHSRFISYLLSNKSGHGKGRLFAELFLKHVFEDNLPSTFLENYEVVPNEFNKSEFQEIDILLVNSLLRHAVIIENKIYAKDSNHEGKLEGYNGQLERYYNTIKKGKIDSNNRIIDHEYKCNKVDVFYLTLNPPKDTFLVSKGKDLKDDKVQIIYYKDQIKQWLDECLSELTNEDDKILRDCIEQYSKLVKNMTKTNIPNQEEMKLLREQCSNHWETLEYVLDNFKHVKWHVVDNFLNELSGELLENKYENVQTFPSADGERAKVITRLTHYDKDENIGIRFSIDNKEYYISTLNNLSWGRVGDQKWCDFKNTKLENIRFSEFLNKNTFRLVNTKNRKESIKLIIVEIENERSNGFKNLREI